MTSPGVDGDYSEQDYDEHSTTDLMADAASCGANQTAFADDAPFMIMSQTSLDKLNEKLNDKVTIERFRPVILVDKSAEWDEDKWLSVHIGDTALQCLKPCFRFRLAPEGPLRDENKESPMFGVDAGVITPGFIHVGQTVYVRYKSAYRKQTPYFFP
ncbi:MOSC domain protein [Teladorsagia circumcincta]|uniref:MOSC domain protein n=1 Tax=Teladorsagia circumcincta TaxID=45464 RepID=A0A2G9TZ48_TELCI|nr:MOSC domain protein [Teladorsagia circumcincta]